MEEVVLNQLLDRASALIREVGIGILHEDQLAAALDLTPAAFQEVFGSKSALLYLATQRNLARRQQEHEQLFAHLASPLECLLGLLHYSLQEMRLAFNYDYHVVRQQFPDAWQLIQNHLTDYSSPLLTRLQQAAVQDGHLRADLQPSLIAHILSSQFNMLVDHQVFPPDQTNLAEVYRNLFFPYIRGLCTQAGLRVVARHFERL